MMPFQQHRESEKNLQQAKQQEKQQVKENDSKLSFLGKAITREYSEKQPSYSRNISCMGNTQRLRC